MYGAATCEGKRKTDRLTILELIDTNDFEVRFQPIYSAKEGKVYGYEALSRIKNREGIDIGSVFRQAKRERLISSLDVLCRENALKQASSLGLHLNGAYLFVNVCPETIMDPAHRGGITDEFAEEYGISKDRIILEITEESAIDNYQSFKNAMIYYRERGYKIAIDDFGAGYGGLKMLSIIEPDFVKIDRHFVKGIDKSEINVILTDAIVSVCHRLGITVIAEGIEREEESLCLLRSGIELLQGYYFHAPAIFPAPDSIILAGLPAKGVKPPGNLHGNVILP